MPGFPSRPQRQDFGPEPQNRYPVRNPEKELDADTVGKLLFHQVAGSGLVVPLVKLIVSSTASGGGSASLVARDEAWNPYYKTAAPHTPPDVTRASAGVIDIAYSANLPNEQGEDKPVVFTGGWAVYLDDTSTVLIARVIPTTPRSSVVRVRGWLISGSSQTPTDGTFLIGLY